MKNEKLEIIESNEFQNLFDKSKKLIDSARSNMGQMANAITVLTSFLLGRYIIEQEQQGSERAKYGAKVLDSLSSYLTEEYGRGFSRSNVAGMRQFYMAYNCNQHHTHIHIRSACAGTQTYSSCGCFEFGVEDVLLIIAEIKLNRIGAVSICHFCHFLSDFGHKKLL